MNTCYIVGAGECPSLPFVPGAQDLVIAADGGFLPLARAGMRMDLAVGDFDSLGHVPEQVRVIRHPVQKDDTDTMLAVKIGLERGFGRFELYGGLGGRLDHTLANIQTLHYLCSRGAVGFLTTGSETLCVRSDCTVTFDPAATGLLSVFSLSPRCEGVELTGLHYPLHQAKLTADFPLGVSNAFTGTRATVSVTHGTLLLLWYGPPQWMQPDATPQS